MPKELVVVAPRQPELRHYDDGPLAEGHVRVKVEFGSPKHGTELVCYRGLRGTSFPHALGNMCVGRVVELGRGAEGVAVGERVAGYGALRETHAWPAQHLLRMPEGMTWQEAVCYDPLQFALGGLRDGHVRIGDCVSVFGLGAIGQMAVQAARLAGAELVCAVDPVPLRREAALKGGAQIAVDPATQDVGAELKKATDGQGVDVAIETSGSYAALDGAIRGIAFGGTVALVGWHGECKGGLDFGEVAHFITPNVVFSRACSEPNRDHPRWSFKRIQEACWRLLSEGRFRCDGIVMPVVPLEDAARAFAAIDLRPENSIKLGVAFGGM